MHRSRRDSIKQLIEEKSSVTLSELEELFSGVSSMTLRRDLEYLETQGVIIRVKGGAVARKNIASPLDNKLLSEVEQSYSDRENLNLIGKTTLAKAALSLVEPGRAIYLDAGTTSMQLARAISPMKLSVLTSGPNIALELIRKNGVNVSLVGGNLNRDNLSLSGNTAVAAVRGINIDTAFLVASGYALESGFTCGNFDECELKKTVLSKARRVVILIDNSKFDKTMPFTFANLENVNILVCDTKPSDIICERARNENVEILV